MSQHAPQDPTRRVGAPPSAYRRQVRSMMAVPRTLPPAMIPGCLMLMGAAFVAIRAVGEFYAPGPMTLGRLLVGSLALGIAMVLSVASIYFRDLRHLWSIFSQVWM